MNTAFENAQADYFSRLRKLQIPDDPTARTPEQVQEAAMTLFAVKLEYGAVTAVVPSAWEDS